VRLLLEHNADVDAKDGYCGLTAPYRAARNGHEAVAQRLLEHKANVDAKGRGGKTALYWAAKNGLEAVVQRLLEHNATPMRRRTTMDGRRYLRPPGMNTRRWCSGCWSIKQTALY
jgi:ankyrin repeat protein